MTLLITILIIIPYLLKRRFVYLLNHLIKFVYISVFFTIKHILITKFNSDRIQLSEKNVFENI